MSRKLNIIKNRAELYDLEYPENFYGDLDFICNHAADGCKSILDLGAGTGRIGFPLLNMGFKVTMVDSDVDMVNIMMKKLDKISDKKLTASAKILCESMVVYKKSNSFGLVIMTGNTFSSLLTRQEQLETLCNVRNSIVDKGAAVIHVCLPDAKSAYLNQFSYTYSFKDMSSMLTYHRYVMETVDSLNGYMVFNFLYKVYRNSTQIAEFCNSATTKILCYKEMEDLFCHAGLKVKTINNDFTTKVANIDTLSCVYVVSKT